jgi:hypothetical protein
MALKKVTETQYGVNCEYWKVTTTNVDWFARTATIIVDGFLNEDARIDRKEPLDKKVYSFVDKEFIFNNEDNLVAKSYEILKEKDFSGSEDC